MAYLFGKETPQIDFATLSTDVWEYIPISIQMGKQGGVVFGVRQSVTFMWQIVEESCQFSIQIDLKCYTTSFPAHLLKDKI